MRRFAFGILGLLGLAFTAAPASAVSCGGEEFLIFAKTDIIFEAGLTSLTGNIINVNPTGKIKIGSNNIINGTVSANKIIVSNGASVTICAANSWYCRARARAARSYPSSAGGVHGELPAATALPAVDVPSRLRAQYCGRRRGR